MIASIGITYTKDIYISSTYAVDIWIECTGIRNVYIIGIYARSIFIEDIEPRVLTRFRVILAGLGVNNYYL